MALGEQYNNNKKFVEPVVHSRYGCANAQSKVDATRMSFDFWSGLLKISISPKKSTSADGITNWDYENNVSIYLSHTKAELFKRELLAFKANKNEYRGRGVGAGAGLITISNGQEYGIECPVITIRKIDSQGGVTSSFAYQINSQYYFSIRNFDEKNPNDYEKQYYEDLEIDQLITVLDEYVRAMTGAIAYSVIDNERFNNSRINTKLDSICEKLGIEYKKGGNAGKSSSSFFSNKGNNNAISDGNKQFTGKTLDQIDEEMMENM